MPTYEYECMECKVRFEREQAMTDAPLKECPRCKGRVRRLVSGGTGFFLKGGEQGGASPRTGSCSFKSTGMTCCGRDQRCSKPGCEE
jgi:putative FmdB family regulatory protein